MSFMKKITTIMDERKEKKAFRKMENFQKDLADQMMREDDQNNEWLADDGLEDSPDSKLKHSKTMLVSSKPNSEIMD